MADADLNRAIVSGLLRHEPAIDFLTAGAAGVIGLTDSEILALAGGTAPRDRFARRRNHACPLSSFQKCRETQRRTVSIPQRLDIATAIDELLLIWLASESPEWENRLEWLPL